MLIAAGNINQAYDVLGIVHVAVSRTLQGAGCGKAGGLPTQAAYEAASQALAQAAAASGGDGVIHVSFDYRIATAIGCASQKPVFEVYGWGTAIKLKQRPS
jgi:uncharacterized protein YbjQ (UPF0145 family)